MNQLELFEERAAIMEYDGGMPRRKAEMAASTDAAKQYLAWLLPITNAVSRRQADFERVGWGFQKAFRMMAREE